MKGKVFCLLAAMLVISCAASAEVTVSNVSASQRGDGSRLVDVYYDLAETNGDWPYVTLKVSTDGGATYTVTASHVTGDGKKNVQPGTGKHMVWDAKQDMPDVSGNNFKAQVNATTCIGYAGPMITIPVGSFQMGALAVEPNASSYARPVHWVQLTAYEIGKYEVTRAEYAKFIETGGYTVDSYWSEEGRIWRNSVNRAQPDNWATQQNWGTPPGTFNQSGRHPVVGITYYEAEAFCNWASQYLLPGDRPYHLPTEAQWEKAARWDAAAVNARVWPWAGGWQQENSNNWEDILWPKNQTSPVGSYPAGASPYGCLDMSGNVYEWCKDWFLGSYYITYPDDGWPPDPEGPPTGTMGILRGGAWNEGTEYGTCSYRMQYGERANSSVTSGFRIAR